MKEGLEGAKGSGRPSVVFCTMETFSVEDYALCLLFSSLLLAFAESRYVLVVAEPARSQGLGGEAMVTGDIAGTGSV